MAELKGTNVAASIVPFSTDDTFPTHDAKYGKGGWRSVESTVEMGSIPDEKLEVGMAVYVVSENKTYILTSRTLIDGVYNNNWEELVLQGIQGIQGVKGDDGTAIVVESYSNLGSVQGNKVIAYVKDEDLFYHCVETQSNNPPSISYTWYPVFPFYYEKTTEQLYDLQQAGELIKGRYYRITDYNCKVKTRSDFLSACHSFDILVKALSNTKLDSHCKALHHTGDTYFQNCDLTKWELICDWDWYHENVDWSPTDEVAIIYMKDEYGNECPYDFKNILYKKTFNDTGLSVDRYLYTFSRHNEEPEQIIISGVAIDCYLDATVVVVNDSIEYPTIPSNNIIEEWIISSDPHPRKLFLNNIISFGEGDGSSSNNFFSSGCHDITFTGSNNFFGENCSFIQCADSNNNDIEHIGVINDSTIGKRCKYIDLLIPSTNNNVIKYLHIEDNITGTSELHLQYTIPDVNHQIYIKKAYNSDTDSLTPCTYNIDLSQEINIIKISSDVATPLSQNDYTITLSLINSDVKNRCVSVIIENTSGNAIYIPIAFANVILSGIFTTETLSNDYILELNFVMGDKIYLSGITYANTISNQQ